jgi:hypothetical protein
LHEFICINCATNAVDGARRFRRHVNLPPESLPKNRVWKDLLLRLLL